MHFSWLMHLLILLLFSRFSSSKVSYGYDDSEEKELTTEPLLVQDPSEESDDYFVKLNIRKTTTPMMKTTKHHLLSNDDDVDYYHEHEDETEVEKISPTTLITTTSPSSSTRKGSTTDAITETTTTTTSEIAVTHSISISYTMIPDIDKHTAFMRTIDPEQITAFLAKTNRDRLLLKIFTITVVVGMFTLAIVLLTIHMIRTKRYRGYRTPANTSTNDRSKHPTTIKV